MSPRGRRPEPRIMDPGTHPRRSVSLVVAAEFLEISTKTLQARIDAGLIQAKRDGHVWKIAVGALVAYRQNHQHRSL